LITRTRATKASEIIQLLEYEDDFAEVTGKDRTAVIQFLVEHVGSPDIGVWIGKDGGKIVGWLFAVCGKLPPLAESVDIFYAHSHAGTATNLEAMSAVEEWAKERGVFEVRAMVNNLAYRFLSKYGYESENKK